MQLAAKAAAMRKKAGQKNRECFKYQFRLESLSTTQLNSLDVSGGTVVSIQVSRGAKVVTTAAVEATQGRASWDQPLEFVCTLYASKKADRAFSEKEFKVILLTTGHGKRPREIASADLDVGVFGSIANQEAVYNHSFRLTPRAKGQSKADAPELTLKLTATFLKDVDIDDDDQSISSMPHFGGAQSTPSVSDSDQQDLGGFEDAASESGSEVSTSEPQRAARRDAAVAELRELKTGLEAKTGPEARSAGSRRAGLDGPMGVVGCRLQ